MSRLRSLAARLAVATFLGTGLLAVGSGSSQAAPSCTISSIESVGARSGAVRCIQRALRAEGLDPGPVDGIFGTQTLGAVRQFQQRVGVRADGVVTPRTARLLGVWRKPPCRPGRSVPSSTTTVVDVRSSGSWATLRLMVRTDSGWSCRGAVMPARTGRNGVRPLAQRVGGDGTTPSGVFGLGRMTAPNGDTFRFFGTRADPGVKGAWHDVRPNDCWWADPGTKKYNRLISRPAHRCTGENEYLPSYRNSYSRAALIAANMGPTGSATTPVRSPALRPSSCIATPRSAPVRRRRPPAASP